MKLRVAASVLELDCVASSVLAHRVAASVLAHPCAASVLELGCVAAPVLALKLIYVQFECAAGCLSDVGQRGHRMLSAAATFRC